MEAKEVDVDCNSKKKVNILFCVTGSVATIKIYQLTTLFQEFGNVQICCSKHSQHFFDKKKLQDECNNVSIYVDQDEWDEWNGRGDPVLHIELRKWADIVIIAPLDANTLAKIANGFSDNLLTCVIRAWDFDSKKKSMIVAPAMNTKMWGNPMTRKHINILKNEFKNINIINPISKKLMCKDVGMGAMENVDKIAQYVKQVSNRILNQQGNDSDDESNDSNGKKGSLLIENMIIGSVVCVGCLLVIKRLYFQN